MAFAYASPAGVLGADFQNKSTTPKFPIGATVFDLKGRKWVYVKAGGTIGAFRLVKAAASSSPFDSVLVATASNAATKVIGLTPLALSSGDYAWIVMNGPVEDDAVVVSASIADGNPFISDANGAAVIAVETDINNICGVCIVDDTDNTGTLFLSCS